MTGRQETTDVIELQFAQTLGSATNEKTVTGAQKKREHKIYHTNEKEFQLTTVKEKNTHTLHTTDANVPVYVTIFIYCTLYFFSRHLQQV